MSRRSWIVAIIRLAVYLLPKDGPKSFVSLAVANYKRLLPHIVECLEISDWCDSDVRNVSASIVTKLILDDTQLNLVVTWETKVFLARYILGRFEFPVARNALMLLFDEEAKNIILEAMTDCLFVLQVKPRNKESIIRGVFASPWLISAYGKPLHTMWLIGRNRIAKSVKVSSYFPDMYIRVASRDSDSEDKSEARMDLGIWKRTTIERIVSNGFDQEINEELSKDTHPLLLTFDSSAHLFQCRAIATLIPLKLAEIAEVEAYGAYHYDDPHDEQIVQLRNIHVSSNVDTLVFGFFDDNQDWICGVILLDSDLSETGIATILSNADLTPFEGKILKRTISMDFQDSHGESFSNSVTRDVARLAKILPESA